MRNHILRDLARFPGYKAQIIFDVGANIGQSVDEFREYYPDATIHSFEPVPATFVELEERTRAFDKVKVYNIALGATCGELHMKAHGTSTGNKIVPAHSGQGTVTVRVEDGAGFCAREGITAIDFLKIDAEGFDFQVLSGFGRMLVEGSIAVVQIEVGLAPENSLHVPFDQLLAYMNLHDYRLFRLTGVQGDRRLGIPKGHLASAHYGDAVFVRNSVTQVAQRRAADEAA